jgi:hypothetical protein
MFLLARNQSATMTPMRHRVRLWFLLALPLFASPLRSQSATGAIALSAHLAASGAYPEPVRQFTFYILTKSYADITKEVASQEVIPTREEFLGKLPVSPALKKWMKAHDVVDLTSPDLDKLVTVDDIMDIPEFFDAYERSNSGGVTKGLPRPKYKESDKQSNPDRYNKEREEYLAATRKFIETNSYTIQGLELELTSINPKSEWDKLVNTHNHKVAQLAPDTAQLKYLAAKGETDLDGHAIIRGLPAGSYWVSSLNSEATSGDRRMLWDVAAEVQAGRTTPVDLTNLNATDAHKPPTP